MTKTFREKEIQAMRTGLEMNGVVSLDDDAIKRILDEYKGWLENYFAKKGPLTLTTGRLRANIDNYVTRLLSNEDGH